MSVRGGLLSVLILLLASPSMSEPRQSNVSLMGQIVDLVPLHQETENDIPLVTRRKVRSVIGPDVEIRSMRDEYKRGELRMTVADFSVDYQANAIDVKINGDKPVGFIEGNFSGWRLYFPNLSDEYLMGAVLHPRLRLEGMENDAIKVQFKSIYINFDGLTAYPNTDGRPDGFRIEFVVAEPLTS